MIIGGGLGLLVPPLTATLLGSVEKSRSGIAAGVLNATRQTGSVLGVALFGALIGRPDTFMRGAQLSLVDLGGTAVDRQRRDLVRKAHAWLRSIRRSGFLRYALRSAKCAPQNAITAPRASAARPATTPATVGTELGPEAA